MKRILNLLLLTCTIASLRVAFMGEQHLKSAVQQLMFHNDPSFFPVPDKEYQGSGRHDKDAVEVTSTPKLETTITTFLASNIPNATTPHEDEGSIVIFYNIYMNPNNTDNSVAIVKEQLEYRRAAPLAASAPLFYVTIGAPNVSIGDCDVCSHLHHYMEGSEGHTLQHVHDHCVAFPKDTIVYLHNKGSFTNTEGNARMRYHLSRGIFSQQCLDLDKGDFNTCSAKVNLLPFFHFPGNMFTAKCEYVRKLIAPRDFDAAKRRALTNMFEDPAGISDYMRLGGKPWAMERSSWLGLGRYAMEHWICSHPTVLPAQVYPSARFSYKIKDIARDWRPILRMPGDTIQKDIAFAQDTLPPWYHLPGKLYQWRQLYGSVPPPSSWIYALFENVTIHDWTKDADPELAIFFHIYLNITNPSVGLQIVEKQMLERRRSMTAATVPLYYVTVGSKDANITTCPTCHQLEHLDEGDELHTMQHLYKYCQKHEAHKVIYLHNKDHFTIPLENEHLRPWHLTRSIFLSDCIENLGDYNTCSAKFTVTPFWSYLGNMFVARCSYVNKLIAPVDFPAALAKVVYTLNTSHTNETDYLMFGGKNSSMQQPSWLGLGRYASEHWIGSHPDMQPAQVYPNNKFMYRMQDFIYKWKPNQRGADASRRETHFLQRHLPPWYHLPGRIYQWKRLYQTLPNNSSWVWELYRNIQILNWTQVFEIYGNDSSTGPQLL